MEKEFIQMIEKIQAEEEKTKELIKSVTPETAVDLLKRIYEIHDTENAHVYADDVLCTLLRNMGYDAIIDTYQEIEKRYA